MGAAYGTQRTAAQGGFWGLWGVDEMKLVWTADGVWGSHTLEAEGDREGSWRPLAGEEAVLRCTGKLGAVGVRVSGPGVPGNGFVLRFGPRTGVGPVTFVPAEGVEVECVVDEEGGDTEWRWRASVRRVQFR